MSIILVSNVPSPCYSLRDGLTVYPSAHIGGFLMGLLVGMVFYPIISATKRHRIIVWSCRIVAIPLAIVLFVVLIRNFYTSDPYAGKLW